MNGKRAERGVSSVLLLVILLVVVTLGLGGLSVWSFANYSDQKNNTQAKVADAVNDAKKTQTATDEAKFAEDAKKPNTSISGPSDFGSVTFSYPKTWSVYVAADGVSTDTYELYFYPGKVPTVSDSQQYALHVLIEQQSYESVLANYQSLVKKGTLKSTVVSVNGYTGIRLDGQFRTNFDASMVIYKVRDKTLIVRTDSQTFRGDFDNSVLPSLTFTP